MSTSPTSKKSKQVKYVLNKNIKNAEVKQMESVSHRSFVLWYKHMIDNERQNIGLYLADNVLLEWFGRTIRTRKKVISFLKYDMQCSKHDFTSIESKEKLNARTYSTGANALVNDQDLASPLQIESPVRRETRNLRKRPGLRSASSSPQWDVNINASEQPERKKTKLSVSADQHTREKELFLIDNKGDGLLKATKRKFVALTPPNREQGQGDGLPSTSESMADISHCALNAQLPKRAVECNGYIQFTRTKSNNLSDGMKWDRKCKVQLLYSDDPLNPGEYIVWEMHYSDESKCRRNLLAAFESSED